jgi:isopenicillin-N N-acyltransferase like protein
MSLKLDKSPFINGKLIGSNSKKHLYKRIRIIKKLLKQQKVRGEIIAAQIRDFTNILKKTVPHWLEEIKGVAEGAGMSTDDLIFINCHPPGFQENSTASCTSFFIPGEEKNILFKIRDERNHVQFFIIRKAGSTPSYQCAADIGNLGIAHFFNGNFVAGANNTGSHIKTFPESPRLNDCHMMRFFAEKASCVEDIPDLFQFLMEKKVAGGASTDRGCIFLFADREKGLILETSADDFSWQYIQKPLVISNHFITRKAKAWEIRKPDKNTTTRKKRMEELLCEKNYSPSVEEIFSISRDRKHHPNSLCNHDKKHFWMTISAQLQVINKTKPFSSKNFICCGNTRNSFYMPFPISAAENFQPLLSGNFYSLANKLYQKHGCNIHLLKKQKFFESSIENRRDYTNMYNEAYTILEKLSRKGQ